LEREVPVKKFRMASRLVIVLALVVSIALVAEAAYADPGYLEDRTAQLINSSRDAHGRQHVSRAWDLDAIARNHSARMAASAGLFHNGNLAGEVPGGWSGLAENVGVGPSVDDVHTAFRNSPSHMANMVGDYDKVGIGVVEAGGMVFITEVFWRSADQPSYSAPAKVKSCRKVKGRTRCSTVKKYKKKAKKVSKSRKRRR
jgi:hypothetical protein